MIKPASIRVHKARKQPGRGVSEGGMNFKTTDINQLINTMGVKSLAGKKREEKGGRWKVKAEKRFTVHSCRFTIKELV